MPSSRPIITAVLFLASIAIAFFFAFPAYENLRAVSRDLQGARKELQYVGEYYVDVQKKAEQLRQYESALKVIDAALPARISLPALFAYLQIVTSQNGVVLAELGKPAVGASDIDPVLRGTAVTLNVNGSYPSLKNLLGSFWRNAKLVDVQSVSFSSPGEEEVFDFQMGIKTYSY